MNCQSFENIVNDLARDQIMEAIMHEQAVLHSEGCAACSVRLREELNLTKELRGLSAGMQSYSAPVSVEARLLSEFRSYPGAKRAAGGRVPREPAINGAKQYRRRHWAYAAVAAAAVIVVVAGLAAIRLGRARMWRETVNTSPMVKKDSPPANPAVEELQANHQDSGERAQPRNSKRAARPSASERFRAQKATVTVVSLKILPPNYDEVTTEFIPIAYSSASNVQEGGQVMRLELPRYAMARFGVPVNVDRYDERVKADVWVGADGLARAIRFVQ